ARYKPRPYLQAVFVVFSCVSPLLCCGRFFHRNQSLPGNAHQGWHIQKLLHVVPFYGGSTWSFKAKAYALGLTFDGQEAIRAEGCIVKLMRTGIWLNLA